MIIVYKGGKIIMKYTEAEIRVISFEAEDVIATSNGEVEM